MKKKHLEQASPDDSDSLTPNAKRQRRFMDKLKTPEKRQELLDYKEQRNARRRELYAKKRLELQQNEEQLAAN